EKRESGIDRDEALLPPRTQIAQREHPFERRERAGAGRLVHCSVPRLRFSQDSGRFRPSSARGFSTNKAACSVTPPLREKGGEPAPHPHSRLTASPPVISSRLPSARFLTSTLPSARPFGPTKICQGIPIRSAVANFGPGRGLRLSERR